MNRFRLNKILILGLSLLAVAAAVSACTGGAPAAQETQAPVSEAAEYRKINTADAKAMIDSDVSLLILDVREQYEFDAGHIEGAVLLPSGSVSAKAAEVLPDQNQTILVYCRSGNRSKTAANMLLEMGYTQVYDFGGIIDWPYEVVIE
ncbi:MAG: rhodanese-like domain-containing protein [Bacillota bacterium]